MILTKHSDYIEDKGDHYHIVGLVVNDSLEIDLDKRLHVSESMFVAGDLKGGIIVVGGSAVVQGMAMVEELQADIIHISKAISANGNVIAKTSVFIGKGSIQGSLVSNGKATFIGDMYIGADLSVHNMLIAKSNLSTFGNIAVGSMMDICGELICDGEVRILGKTADTYGRLNGFNHTIIIAGKMLFFVRNNNVTTAVDDIDEFEADLPDINSIKRGSKEFEYILRESWIRHIASKIKRSTED